MYSMYKNVCASAMAAFPQSEEINICMNMHVLNVLWALVSITQTKIAVHLKSAWLICVCFTVYRLNHFPIPCFFIVTILITTKVV